jgi:hypothetical protein
MPRFLNFHKISGYLRRPEETVDHVYTAEQAIKVRADGLG